MEHLMTAPYKTRAAIGDDNYLKYGFDGSDYSSFPVPTVALVDYTDTAVKDGRAGLSEVLFTITAVRPIPRGPTCSSICGTHRRLFERHDESLHPFGLIRSHSNQDYRLKGRFSLYNKRYGKNHF
jgi:hypothetical protein